MLSPTKMWSDLKVVRTVADLLNERAYISHELVVQLEDIVERYSSVLSQWRNKPEDFDE